MKRLYIANRVKFWGMLASGHWLSNLILAPGGAQSEGGESRAPVIYYINMHQINISILNLNLGPVKLEGIVNVPLIIFLVPLLR